MIIGEYDKINCENLIILAVGGITLKKIKSPVDGILISLKVAVGDKVTKGQIVAVILILKMENPVPSKWDGIVQEIVLKPKARIKRGQLLMTITQDGDDTALDCGRSALPNIEPDPKPAE